MNIAQAYERVNQVQPVAPISVLTFEEAEKAIRKMYRHLTGSKFPYPMAETSGNRYTWKRNGTFFINVEKGWNDLIHLFSHWYYTYRIGGRPHSKVHARLERKLRKWAVSHGWMNGALRAEEAEEVEPSPDAVRDGRIQKRIAQVARLERRIKALTTRLKTAKRSLGALQRHAQKI